MQLVILGAAGHVARRIAREALDRGHQVVGVVRDASRFQPYDDRLQVVEGDATDAASIARVARGADAIVNAISPRPSPAGRPASSLVASARAIIAGAREAGVKRIIIVGGAGSLEVAPGVQLVDTPDFPDLYKGEALAGRESFAVYRTESEGLDWTYISPAIEIGPGKRTGKFRTGRDQILVDDQGKSFISYEDYAVAVVDELEQARNPRRRIAVAY
jgi:putative NADH-flavin reductase